MSLGVYYFPRGLPYIFLVKKHADIGKLNCPTKPPDMKFSISQPLWVWKTVSHDDNGISHANN